MRIQGFERAPREPLAPEFVADGVDDPRRVLVATRNGAFAGALRGAFTAHGFRVIDVRGDEDAAAALLDAARARFPGQRVEVQLDGETHARLAPALRRAGAEQVLEQLLFERALPAQLDGARPRFTWRRYQEVGRARLLALLERIFAAGPSGRGSDDASAELDQLILDGSADGELDASLWRVAELDGAPVGVALAQRDRPAAGEGVLLYLGVVPEQRGRGLGRALHAETLRELAAAGLTRYRDATAAANLPMRRVLERHGCRVEGALHLWVLRRPVERGRLDGAAALARYLDEAGYRVERAQEPGWWRAPVAFGRDQALVELGWLDDARVVALAHRYAFRVPPERHPRAALRVAALNASLTAPGFQLDEQAGQLSFRVALHLDEAGGLSVHHLRRGLATVVRAAARYHADLAVLAEAVESRVTRVPLRSR